MANQSAKLIRNVDSVTSDGERIRHDETTDLKHVVYQATTIYSGTGNDRQITANGILFLYAGVTEPMPTISRLMSERMSKLAKIRLKSLALLKISTLLKMRCGAMKLRCCNASTSQCRWIKEPI